MILAWASPFKLAYISNVDPAPHRLILQGCWEIDHNYLYFKAICDCEVTVLISLVTSHNRSFMMPTVIIDSIGPHRTILVTVSAKTCRPR